MGWFNRTTLTVKKNMDRIIFSMKKKKSGKNISPWIGRNNWCRAICGRWRRWRRKIIQNPYSLRHSLGWRMVIFELWGFDLISLGFYANPKFVVVVRIGNEWNRYTRIYASPYYKGIEKGTSLTWMRWVWILEWRNLNLFKNYLILYPPSFYI